jgi:hypothetical protein
VTERDADGFPQPGDPVPGAPPALTVTEPATRPEPAAGSELTAGSEPMNLTRPAPRSRTRGVMVAAVLVTALVGWALLRRPGNQSEES